MIKGEFIATVSKMGRHKMISVPAKHSIQAGDRVKVIKIKKVKE